MIVVAPSKTQEAHGPWETSIVFLDMVQQDDCVYADDVAGMIKRRVQQSDGKVVFDAYGNIVEETVYGKVTIIRHMFMVSEVE